MAQCSPTAPFLVRSPDHLGKYFFTPTYSAPRQPHTSFSLTQPSSLYDPCTFQALHAAPAHTHSAPHIATQYPHSPPYPHDACPLHTFHKHLHSPHSTHTTHMDPYTHRTTHTHILHSTHADLHTPKPLHTSNGISSPHTHTAAPNACTALPSFLKQH